ncbi:hypothetical protein ES707_03435 [subsurface metagenome]
MRIAGLSALTMKSVNLYGTDLAMSSLDAKEQAVLEDNWNKLLGTSDSQVRRIFEERADTIVQGIMAIKSKLKDRAFRGLNPSDAEIGFSFFRPEFVKATDTEKSDWSVSLTAEGTWVDWLDKSTGVAYPLPEDFGYIITHLVSQVTPEPLVRAARFEIGRVTLIPEDVSDILLGDNLNGVAVYPIPTKIVLPEDEFLAKLNGATGTGYVKLGGFVVGLGRILKAETPSW